MKKLLIAILIILLFAGCTTAKQPEPVETIPAVSLMDAGTPWDREGTLFEIHLSIPGGEHFSNMLPFDGDLLVWSLDDHLEDQNCLELCIVSLNDGSVIASRDIKIENYAFPQTLGECLYICDNYSGTVLRLDKGLNEVERWELQPNESSWYYGGDRKVYQHLESSRFWVYDLVDGSFEPLFSGDPVVNYSAPDGNILSLEYYHPETAAATYAVLNLLTGELIQPEEASGYGYTYAFEDSWISARNGKPFNYRFSAGGGAPMQLNTDGYYVELLADGRLLLTSEDSQYLHLFDLNGKPISSCRLSENGTYWASELIWNDQLNGYYLLTYAYDNTYRVLFWDIGRPSQMEQLQFTPIPEPSAEEAALLHRCEEIGTQYGVSILIGNECDAEFFDFTAQPELDWLKVNEELDVLEEALGDYPEGFFKQFRRQYPKGVQILLVRDIVPTAESQFVGDYTAFVEHHWDVSSVVVDVEESDLSTYYHEFSHVIDDYLEWDRWEREDALFSEDSWNTLNPAWFAGYTFDYSQKVILQNYTHFVDPYSTINQTEDRARVMEYAMSEYGRWTFEGAGGLINKLDYYSRCIRDAFDTTGWPEIVRWEQYLNNGIG